MLSVYAPHLDVLHVSPQAAGVVLAYVGAHIIKSYDNFDSFIQDKYTLVPAAIIIGISVVMFIFGLVGCCATLRESKVGLSFVSALSSRTHVCLSGSSTACLALVSEGTLILMLATILAFVDPITLFYPLYSSHLLSSSPPPVFSDHHGDLCC